MPEPILAIKKLSMRYGKTLALDSLNLEIEEGDVYGLIGPNGAGKSTTFKIVSTILRQTAGEVWVGGFSVKDTAKLKQVRRLIGYMPDVFGVYEDMTVEEYLTFFAAAYDLKNPERKHLVNDVLELVELTGKRDQVIEALSRGMQQRLGIARVLIHDPKLLILDEPASGLDPRARVEIRGLLRELQKMGKTILISSHILADLGEICNRIGIIEKGKLLVDGKIEDVLKQVKASSVVFLRVEEIEEAQILLKKLPFVQDVVREKETLAVEVIDGFRDVWKISQAVAEAGLRLTYIEQETESLERAFIELTEGTVS